MTTNIRIIKKKLDNSISQLCNVSWIFSSNPEKDFSRERKLPLKKVISILLSMHGSDFKIPHNPDYTASSLCPFLHKNTLKTFFSLKCVLFLGFVLLAIS